MKKLKLTPGDIIKLIASLVAALVALYAFVYVPSQQLMLSQQAVERAEVRVHNSCILIAQQATEQAIANPPEDATEDPTQEQINNFLNIQYSQCIAAEGYNPDELAQKYLQTDQQQAPAAQPAITQ